MLSHLQPTGPLTMGAATACAILRDATSRLGEMRGEIEREIFEYARSREHVEALIHRLIVGLDDMDANDDGREPAADAEGSDGVTPYGDAGQPAEWWRLSKSERMQRPAYLDDDCEPSLGWTAKEAARGVPFQGAKLDAEAVNEDGDESDEDGDAVETHGHGLRRQTPHVERFRCIVPARKRLADTANAEHAAGQGGAS